MIKNAFIKVGTAIGMLLMVIAPSPVRAANRCGSGYALVERYTAHDDVYDTLGMYADLYYSSSAKRNCLVAEHAGSLVGSSEPTLAQIWPSGYATPACNSVGCDKGNYKYYAGPVYTPAGVNMAGRCVNFNAEVGFGVHKERRNVHCG